jgi:hypothetical protein
MALPTLLQYASHALANDSAARASADPKTRQPETNTSNGNLQMLLCSMEILTRFQLALSFSSAGQFNVIANDSICYDLESSYSAIWNLD